MLRCWNFWKVRKRKMPSCPANTKVWRIGHGQTAPISELLGQAVGGVGGGERAKVPLCERFNDLSAVNAHFKTSLGPLRQHRIHQWRIINLQNIIQSPLEPSNCMLQLIEVLIQLLELLCNFSLNRSLDGKV